MNDVLVLNASYEPLARVTWKRAVCLVVSGKAVIEEALEGRLVRSQYGDYLWPVVVRLILFVKTPYHFGEIPFTKSGVLKRDSYVCAYCGKKADSIDHIIPQSLRPDLSRDWLNCVSACTPCNNKKRNRTPEEANMSLDYQPHTPRGLIRRQ